MKLLLDTHIWLWYLLEPERLSEQLTRHITDPENELWLSPISVWETVLLAQKKRIELKPSIERWINSSLSALGTKEATLNHQIAILSRTVELPHQDPADRFIAATAVYYKLTLATADQKPLNSPSVETVS